MNSSRRLAAMLAAGLLLSIGAAAPARAAPDSAPSADTKPYIVYSGGFMGTPKQPPRYFRGRGYEVRIVSNHLIEMSDVHLFAYSVASEIKRAYRDSGNRKVVFIGYSLGGLAGLYAMRHLGIADMVSTFIAVGSPFHGSNLAWLGIPSGIFTLTGLEVNPLSPFFRELIADPLPAGTRFVSFSGSKDTVCPPSTTLLKGAESIPLVRGHDDFFRDPDIFPLMEARF